MERVTSVRIFSENIPVIVRARRASMREPTYAGDLRAMIEAVVERKLQEEQEEHQLRRLLAGRVVGGADKFGCIKVRQKMNVHIDGSSDWRRRLNGSQVEVADFTGC